MEDSRKRAHMLVYSMGCKLISDVQWRVIIRG